MRVELRNVKKYNFHKNKVPRKISNNIIYYCCNYHCDNSDSDIYR